MLSALEISIIVIFSAATLFAFSLYFINSFKIRKNLKKQGKNKDQETKCEKKDDKIDNNKSEKDKENKDVLEAKVVNETLTQTSPAVAIIKEEKTELNNVKEENLEEVVVPEVITDIKISKKNKSKSVKQQIDELSPELKAILLTDIIKPKY